MVLSRGGGRVLSRGLVHDYYDRPIPCRVKKLTAFQYFPAFIFSQILPRLFTPNKARRIYGWLRSGQYDGM